MLAVPGVVRSILPASRQWRSSNRTTRRSPTDDFLLEIEALFNGPLVLSNLLTLSQQLQAQFKDRLSSSPISMLPSYNHTLPRGDERGTYLALDVGGSTLRVALVELAGRNEASEPMRISRMESWRIDDSVKLLTGNDFFDWMAGRIDEMLSKDGSGYGHEKSPLPMGLAWSFPIEQTSIRSGTLLGMGKGFYAAHGVLGQDLGDLIMQACQRRDMNVKMDAIVNDASATLLSRAYLDPSTRLALILGTGLNAAIHLPVTALAPSKFGSRPQDWHDNAAHVLVNTELSMFGKGILPTTRWDEDLNATHLLPDFQPLEHLVSGRYLGEIVRLILVEAVQTAGLFGGELPRGLSEPYAFATSIVAAIEADTSPCLASSRHLLSLHHPFTSPTTSPTHADLLFLQRVTRCVSRRAATYVATGIHALWTLRISAEGLSPRNGGRVAIGCNGSVIEKYPDFSKTCQATIDSLVELSGGQTSSVVLEPAVESALFGAAVAVSCVESERI
ncbi:MAG: 18S rRNA maturation protein [Chaenotheca gracillima]|nr:MAG: 18S rRNA maturation protein [Chaenotheca gracillima]